MSRPRVAVVGGGLAGLEAALACADAGAEVTLLESRARLGGATWSTQRDGLWVDNGQHVFLRCCEAYRAFLRRLGVEHEAPLQERLDIPVLMPGRPPVRLRRGRLPAPFHLSGGLLGYTHLGWAERLRIGRAALALRRLDPSDPSLDALSFGDWLAAHGQSAEAVERFWDLFAVATLNLPAREASLALAVKVFRTGLLDDAGAGDIGVSRVPLAQLHAEPAARALAARGARVLTRAPVDAVEGSARGGLRIRSRGQRLVFDAVVLATPHDAAAELLPDAARVDRAALRALGHSPIVNLHVVYDRRVTELELAAGVATPVQWVFDRTAASGLSRGQYLAVSLSAADPYVGASREELARVFEPELARLFPAARAARLERLFITCERAATFRQAPGSAAHRPPPATGVPGLFLAGAWTDTGWPATMEGAVRSGRAAAEAALAGLGLRYGGARAAA